MSDTTFVSPAGWQTQQALTEEGDYFSLLGLSPHASTHEIRQAYLNLRRTFDPEHQGNPSFQPENVESLTLIREVLDEAYEILRDPVRRERYQKALERGLLPK